MADYMFSIAKDFSRFPGPRYKHQGPNSGETLRHKLVKLLREREGKLIIDLDGTVGYGSSFLDEAFGGLIRSEGFDRSTLDRRLSFISRLDPTYIIEIEDSIRTARAQ